jgi:hypothetical protein
MARSSLVFEHLGAAVTPYIRLRLEDVATRTVCVVDVERFAEAVFENQESREFYVRVGTTTRALEAEETLFTSSDFVNVANDVRTSLRLRRPDVRGGQAVKR